MKSIDEIVELSEQICGNLQRMIAAEYQMTYEMQIRLEQMEWEQIRWVSEIKAIKERYC